MIVECPISIQWIISKARLDDLLKVSTIQCFKSDSWDAFGNDSGVKYCFYLHPWVYNLMNDENESILSLNVTLGNEKRIESEYKISIKSVNFSIIRKDIFDKNLSIRGFGCCICLSRDLFDPVKNIFVDGKMVIKVEGVLKVERPNIQKLTWENGDLEKNIFVDGKMIIKVEGVLKVERSKIQKLTWENGDLGDCLWERNDKDFVILVEGKEIQVHKLILASRSPVFEKMFATKMKESAENKVEIIDFSFTVVEAAIFMCYEKPFNSILTIDEYMLLLQFFDKYNIDSLKDKIELHLIGEINESNVCRLVNSSLLSNSPKLYEKCGIFLKNALENNTPVSDMEYLDKDLAINLLKNVFCYVSKTV
uniref:BTB domain-containing protein n=1 Tax=Panagrolaimus sp. ES5 TaxID=591445 RepID=A0AC34G815_9BILA